MAGRARGDAVGTAAGCSRERQMETAGVGRGPLA